MASPAFRVNDSDEYHSRPTAPVAGCSARARFSWRPRIRIGPLQLFAGNGSSRMCSARRRRRPRRTFPTSRTSGTRGRCCRCASRWRRTGRIPCARAATPRWTSWASRSKTSTGSASGERFMRPARPSTRRPSFRTARSSTARPSSDRYCASILTSSSRP